MPLKITVQAVRETATAVDAWNVYRIARSAARYGHFGQARVDKFRIRIVGKLSSNFPGGRALRGGGDGRLDGADVLLADGAVAGVCVCVF